MTDKNCDCQTLFIETTAKNKAKQVIGVLYRHPKPDFQSFSTEYENVLTKLANERKKYCILGDYNIDALRASMVKKIDKYIDMIYSSGACMPIDRATRVPLHTERCCGTRRINSKKRKKCNLLPYA